MARQASRACLPLCGWLLLAQMHVVRSARQQLAAMHDLMLEENSTAPAGDKCKGDIFWKWWTVGAVPTGAVAKSGTYCQSPCRSDCNTMLDTEDFDMFKPLKPYFQISDWGHAAKCNFGKTRRKCRVVITDPEKANEELGKLKALSQPTSQVTMALSKASIITHWLSKARQDHPKDNPACGCSVCAASVMPYVLEDAGYSYEVVGVNPNCTSSRGYVYPCSQYLAESTCTCSECFGGTDENEEGLRRKWSYLLGFSEYASDVAYAMRDLLEQSPLGKDTCGGDCMYDRRDWQGQK